MPIVPIEHADPDAHAARGRRACRYRREHAAIERVLGKPDGIKSACIRDLGELDATTRVDAAVQAQAQLREIEHACILTYSATQNINL
jgi:hypothetical protein